MPRLGNAGEGLQHLIALVCRGSLLVCRGSLGPSLGHLLLHARHLRFELAHGCRVGVGGQLAKYSTRAAAAATSDNACRGGQPLRRLGSGLPFRHLARVQCAATRMPTSFQLRQQ